MTKLPIDLDRQLDAFAGVGDPGALEAFYAASRGEVATGRTAPRPSSRGVGGGGEVALLEAYRTRGFLKARLDPLGLARPSDVPELAPAQYGLDAVTAARLVSRLEAAYCGPIGWEFGHIHDQARRRWLEAQAERPEDGAPSDAERTRILVLLNRAAAFERGLDARIPAGKHFGIGGAETFLVLLETLLGESVRLGVEEAVIGGMHRGRFAMLATVLGKSLAALIAEITGKPAIPDGIDASSDVSYHLGYSGDREIAGGHLHLSVSPHPSHLQLAPIIAQGRARAKQTVRGEPGRRAVLPLLLHTDASFSGQGLVAEMLQLSRVGPFDLGGTVHVIVNNQLGFTTRPEEGRSARSPTDIGRLVEAPILHVNGDDVEAVYRAALVAANWRALFETDILIDLVCYRRPGHNEIDEPRFTQPLMYQAIDQRPQVHEIYAATLAARGLDAGVGEVAAQRMGEDLRSAFDTAKSYKVNAADRFEGAWTGMRAGDEAEMLAPVATGIASERLRDIATRITTPPAGFALDAKVQRFLDERRKSLEAGTITWASGEALAIASLLAEGTSVRLGGQDTLRGAFTQRHLELHDQATGARHMTLAAVASNGARAELHNTPLIEHAVLTYEYGISLADPHRLVIWEAQFGEFLNYAQPVFDQCIACGEDRWLRSSGLVILLPHGLDGGGPDHSTGRPERLLAACAGANIQVVNASTPANFFHALRRQMHRPFRKPLVVLTPKALLRHKGCVSPAAAFAAGTGFRAVIGDNEAGTATRRVVLCTGKLYYELAEARAKQGLVAAIALVRVEQLYPLPVAEIAAEVGRWPTAEVVWAEEEPANMGYFTHLDRRLERALGRTVRRVGRPAVATPAVGVKYWHEAEAKAVVEAALG